MVDRNRRSGMNRRQFLGAAGAGAAGVVGAAMYGSGVAHAHGCGNPIKIGAMFISSGGLGGYGKHGRVGIELAVEQINDEGGILGRRVEAIVEDTELNPDRVLQLAERFVKQDKVDFLMGPTSSGLAGILSEFARENKKILVLTQAADDELTGPYIPENGKGLHPYVFSTLSNAMMHSRSGAYFMVEKEPARKKYMCVAPGYSYGKSSSEMFLLKLKDLDSSVQIIDHPEFRHPNPDLDYEGVLYTNFPGGPFEDAIELLLEIEADPTKGVDAVWCPLWGSDAVNFINAVLQKDQENPGTPGIFDRIKFAFPVAGALEVLGPLGDDMPTNVYVSSRYFFNSESSTLNQEFVEEYKLLFPQVYPGEPDYMKYPDYMAQETYAGVYFIKAAVERAHTTNAQAFIKAVEREPLSWETPEGLKIMRGADHSVFEDVLWGETTVNPDYDFYIPLDYVSIPGELICRTPEELEEVRRNNPYLKKN